MLEFYFHVFSRLKKGIFCPVRGVQAGTEKSAVSEMLVLLGGRFFWPETKWR